MRALFAEAEIASLLIRNKVPVRIIGESGTRGEDFDMLATVRGVPVSIEVTAIEEGAIMSPRSILNRLRSKRKQVPPTRPAILYVVVPSAWMKNYKRCSFDVRHRHTSVFGAIQTLQCSHPELGNSNSDRRYPGKRTHTASL
jgi:hypothetical protein